MCSSPGTTRCVLSSGSARRGPKTTKGALIGPVTRAVPPQIECTSATLAVLSLASLCPSRLVPVPVLRPGPGGVRAYKALHWLKALSMGTVL
jgi:hypothetical protein